MTAFFANVVDRGITAGFLVLLVVLLRLVLCKAPKWTHVLLWGLVALRLACPFSIESPFSLLSEAELVTEQTIQSITDTMELPNSTTTSRATNDFLTGSEQPQTDSPGYRKDIYTCIWLGGVAVMLTYLVVSNIRIRRCIRQTQPFEEGVYIGRTVPSPFVYGLLCPRIYLPANMDATDIPHVIAHEKAHIRRLDPWWKLVGFLLLTIYWFSPLLWLGYILFCRDIELACDERVVRDRPMAERAAYAEALLACSVGNKTVRHIGRLAFGEVGVQTRIRSVLRYRKPALWIVGSALFVCIAAALCFLTDPVGSVYDHEWYFVQSTTTRHDNGKTTVCYQPGQTSPDDDAEAIDTVLIPHTEAMWYELISGTWDIDRATLHILPDEEDRTRYTVEWYDDHDTFITVGEAVLERKNLFSKAYTLTMHCVFDATALDMVFTTEAPPALPSGEKTLTLADVTALTERRTALTWDDLADYRYTDVGVGQFVCRYPIDDTYTLVATGGSMVGEPMSIRLYKGEASVDVQRKPFRGFVDDAIG